MLEMLLDIPHVQANARQIAESTGVEVLAVIKADAYGLGARRVAEALADCVDGFCVFSLAEAQRAGLEALGRPIIAIGPPDAASPQAWLDAGVRPAVSSLQQAQQLAPADPLLCIDTGMQRFACPPEEVEAVLRAGLCREVFTHATGLAHVLMLQQLTDGFDLRRHAAASSLLDEPAAYLDAVRPGLALYHGAVTIWTPLVEVRRSRPPVGYSGFSTALHGVILAGYAHGLRPGICRINGGQRRIVEVGMQSSYVELTDREQPGDMVTLLGDGLEPADPAPHWRCTPHEVLLCLARGSAGNLP